MNPPDAWRILVLGAGGMLGHAVHRVLATAGLAVMGSVRGDSPPSDDFSRGLEFLTRVDAMSFETVVDAIEAFRPTAIVNAIGLKQPAEGDSSSMWTLNALFPRRLEILARSWDIYLVHFGTDGVFDGTAGPYDELSLPTPVDDYSRTKFLGEVAGEGALTIRTSMIGRSLNAGSNLVDWALGQRGKTISAYSRVRFSGLPVGEIARFLRDRIFATGTRPHGLFHLAADPIDKFALLRMILDRWAADDITLVDDASVQLDRTLTTLRPEDFGDYRAPSWPVMIDAMYHFYSPPRASNPGAAISV